STRTASLDAYTLSLHDALPILLASHYLEAYRAAPDAPDAAEIKRQAMETLLAAGEHAASLAAAGQAQRYFDAATELADDPVTQADRKSTRLNSSRQIISYAVLC